ncbi:hypothetical protein [Halomontanus rarus]|nr:hypothetical protein [Halovivax sp. TS33]
MSDDSDLEATDALDHTCPNCGEPVVQVTVKGPADRVFGPCGCRIPDVDR